MTLKPHDTIVEVSDGRTRRNSGGRIIPLARCDRGLPAKDRRSLNKKLRDLPLPACAGVGKKTSHRRCAQNQAKGNRHSWALREVRRPEKKTTCTYATQPTGSKGSAIGSRLEKEKQRGKGRENPPSLARIARAARKRWGLCSRLTGRRNRRQSAKKIRKTVTQCTHHMVISLYEVFLFLLVRALSSRRPFNQGANEEGSIQSGSPRLHHAKKGTIWRLPFKSISVKLEGPRDIGATIS